MDYEAKKAVGFPVLEYLELELHLLDTRPGVKPEEFIVELVKRWMSRDTERLAVRSGGSTLRGFQWKTLFLPDGTILRTSRDSSVEFAKVCDDRIIADDGAALTPSLFANRHTTGRNAWRFVWLRFPGEEAWVRADNCRDRSSNMPRKRSNARTELYKTVQKCSAGRSKTVQSSRSEGDFAPIHPAFR